MKAIRVAPIIINKDSDGTFAMDYSENESMRSSSRSPKAGKQPPAQPNMEADSGFLRALRVWAMLLGWRPAATKGKKLQTKKSGKGGIRWTPRRDDR
jgi:hypothetical protein